MHDEDTPRIDEPSSAASASREAHFARAMAVARRGMRKYRKALKELAGIKKAEQPRTDE